MSLGLVCTMCSLCEEPSNTHRRENLLYVRTRAKRMMASATTQDKTQSSLSSFPCNLLHYTSAHLFITFLGMSVASTVAQGIEFMDQKGSFLTSSVRSPLRAQQQQNVGSFSFVSCWIGLLWNSLSIDSSAALLSQSFDEKVALAR